MLYRQCPDTEASLRVPTCGAQHIVAYEQETICNLIGSVDGLSGHLVLFDLRR